jgi:hypothetical protein
VGRAYGEALLLGKERTDPLRGAPIEDAAPRWHTFCEQILDRSSEDADDAPPVDLTFHVPEVRGRELDDIRRQGDDTRFANLCFRLVERLTREDELPLIGSIAGGRKTMSAHLMTAFSVYARPDADRLTHVLVSDPTLEGDSSFFYPERGHPKFGQLLDLVDIRVPRLRSVLEADLIDGLPDDRRDLEGILDALEPHINSARTVTTVRLELRDHDARLVFEGSDGPLDTCPLTTKQAATLLVFADRRAASEGPVPSTVFVDDEEVEAGRNKVRWLCSEEPLKPWTSTDDVSKDISKLKSALSPVPVAQRLLRIEGLSNQPRQYDWPGDSPPLEVAARHAPDDWPFEHLSPPERVGDASAS